MLASPPGELGLPPTRNPGSAPASGGGTPTYDFVKCSKKLHEIEKKILAVDLPLVIISRPKYMSHFAYACKMRYPLNLVLESWEYLWFY